MALTKIPSLLLTTWRKRLQIFWEFIFFVKSIFMGTLSSNFFTKFSFWWFLRGSHNYRNFASRMTTGKMVYLSWWVSFTIFTFPLNTLLKAILITLSAKGVDSSNSSFTLQKLFNIYHLRLCNATDGWLFLAVCSTS